MYALSLAIQILEVPGIFFHVSVLIVLVRGIRRKDESFRHAFFMLYIASSVADCVFIIVVSRRAANSAEVLGGGQLTQHFQYRFFTYGTAARRRRVTPSLLHAAGPSRQVLAKRLDA